MGKTTIKDVAREAGVGIATVSRVINGNYPVSDAVRQRVQTAISQLNYRPDGIARSLKVQKTFLVGVVIADLSNSFFMQLVKGIEKTLSPSGYSIVIADHEENPRKEQQIIEMFLEKKVDAIITTTCQTEACYFEQLRKTNVPIIFVDRLIDGLDIDTVIEDNEANSYDLVSHLIACGHSRIGVITGDTRVHTSRSRYLGYIKALQDHGLQPDPRLTVHGHSIESYDAVRTMLASLSPDTWPSAIFATNNKRAESVLRACMDLGIAVPDTISVASYGNISLPWLFSLKLTHVEQDLVRIGQKTGEMVLRKLANPNSGYKEYTINSPIIYGNSVRVLTPEPDKK